MHDADFLTELCWFAAVVELGSYSTAAMEAGVATSSISRRIKQLEDRLGVQLLDRHTRKLTLTSIGEEIYQHAVSMQDAAQAAQVSAWAISDKPSGPIRIAIPTILSKWLLGVFSRFHKQYPDVRYEVHLDDNLHGLSHRHFDLCLSFRSAPSDSANLVARPVMKLQQGLYTSPEFAQNIQSMRMEDLTDQHLLAWSNRRIIQPWTFQSTNRTITSPALVSSDLKVLKEAARAGLGIACLPTLACTDELEKQTLSHVFEDAKPEPLELISLTPSFRGITLATRYLTDFLRAESVPPNG